MEQYRHIAGISYIAIDIAKEQMPLPQFFLHLARLFIGACGGRHGDHKQQEKKDELVLPHKTHAKTID